MKILLIILLITMIVCAGCATVLYPSRMHDQPEDTTYQFDYGMCFVDVVCWGLLGLIYDVITGAIWIPYSGDDCDDYEYDE